MGSWHNYAMKEIIFAFFGSSLGLLDCYWRRNFFNLGIFFLFGVTTIFIGKAMRTTRTKQHNCRFLVLKRNIQHKWAGFALSTVIETGDFVGSKVNKLFISTCWTKHISNSLLFLVVHTQFFLSIFERLNWNNIEQMFVVLKVYLSLTK